MNFGLGSELDCERVGKLDYGRASKLDCGRVSEIVMSGRESELGGSKWPRGRVCH